MFRMEEFKEGCVFVERIYGPRVVGTFCCGLVISLTSYSKMSSVVLILLALNSLAWAHIARGLALSSKDPFNAEKRNFLVDSLFCGVWIAVMDFNPIPSATIFSMVAMNNVSVGGPKFLIKGSLYQLIGFLMAVMIFGLSYPKENVSSVWVCVSLLVIYPVVMGFAFYGLASELKESKRLLRELSFIDPLTGLLNRRHWNDMVSACLTRKRIIESSVLVIIDVDGFKFVNDRYGHASGDKVLCILSDLLTAKLRAVDYICRYGGDEFCVFLADISCMEVEERMREISNSFALESNVIFPEVGVTLSIGMMPWKVGITEVSAWVSLADKNLYKAKSSGKNKIVCDFV